MIVARNPRRSGITLTEILIAILIMAVGLISLATLFPLGLIRLREASRLGRAGTTVRTAADDLDIRALLYKPSFRNTWYGERDPFVQDALPNGSYNLGGTFGNGVIASGSLSEFNNNVTSGNPLLPDGSSNPSADGLVLLPLPNGLPICYDPLWRAVTGTPPMRSLRYNPGNRMLYEPSLYCESSYIDQTNTDLGEARFGAGLYFGGSGYLHPYISVNPLGGIPSAYGLQRITNFIPWNDKDITPLANQTSQYSFTYANPSGFAYQPADVAGNVFTSIDDVIFNEDNGKVGQSPFLTTPSTTPFSSLVPFVDPTTGSTMADYRFSWFFTGRQNDANGNGAQFTGEIVVTDSRPFGFDRVPETTAFAPSGEIVVEAIYGYGGNPRSVLLRWNNKLADPPLRVGGWIADTTYERNVPTYRIRADASKSPFVRCYWYQIARRTDAGPDPTNAGQRSAVVTLATPVRVTTPTPAGSPGSPPHLNVALIMPSVINVFPRSFEVH